MISSASIIAEQLTTIEPAEQISHPYPKNVTKPAVCLHLLHMNFPFLAKHLMVINFVHLYPIYQI